MHATVAARRAFRARLGRTASVDRNQALTHETFLALMRLDGLPSDG
jgi:hypothetical protein